jgi:hypothetical protein
MIIIKDTIASGSYGARIYTEDRCILVLPIAPNNTLPNGDTELRAYLIAAIAQEVYGLTIRYSQTSQSSCWLWMAGFITACLGLKTSVADRSAYWTLIECQFYSPHQLFLIEGLEDGRPETRPISYNPI